MIRILIAVLLAIQTISQVAPPTWPEAFHQVFVETYPNSKVHVSGRFYYDEVKASTRVDRHDGSLDFICGTVLPNVTTPCTQLITNKKRWVIFPEKRSCCFCCDSAHGCGVLKRNWLSTAKYEGEESISNESFYKWSIPDGDATDYYLAKKNEERIPRRLISGDESTQDFIMNTYVAESINSTVFTLPDYCKNTCPSTSACTKFQTSGFEQY